MLPKTIHQVLKELNSIRDECLGENNRLAIFTQVYYLTTKNVLKAIEAKEFDDNQRMADFDVAFANMYILAYRQYRNNEECSQVWQVAFDHANSPISIVQQVLIGMNAHINYDLGAVTHNFFKGSDFRSFEADFRHINRVLERSINQMQRGINRVSPLFIIIDWMGKNKDEEIIDFSMRHARSQAWRLAEKLAAANSEDEVDSLLYRSDSAFSLFARGIINPKSKLLRMALKLVSVFERKSLRSIIERLQ